MHRHDRFGVRGQGDPFEISERPGHAGGFGASRSGRTAAPRADDGTTGREYGEGKSKEQSGNLHDLVSVGNADAGVRR